MMNKHETIFADTAEFVELFLLAILVVVLTPLWLPVRMVKRFHLRIKKARDDLNGR